ncbi:hypothetical protein ABWJ92_23775 [Streptomyces sp. NPDC000609]|uniref:hypothetical protein n=1 Tax=Streptomyces sp. NPDC000609 TaxID=3160957 RepID=UPI0033954B5B
MEAGPGTARQRRAPHRDHLGFDIAAHALFVVGSSTAFREHGTAPRSLVDEAPSSAYRYPDAGHFCVELSHGPWTRARTRRNVPARLRIQYNDTWRI